MSTTFNYIDEIKCPVDGCKKKSRIGHSNKKDDKQPEKYKKNELLICPIHKKEFELIHRIKITTIEEIVE